jgi:hypothetical protein
MKKMNSLFLAIMAMIMLAVPAGLTANSSGLTLQQALSTSDGYALKRYLSKASMAEYMRQRGDGLLQEKLNQISKYSDQWTKLQYALQGAVENDDYRLRKMIYSDLLKVDVKKGSGFLAGSMRGKYKSNIKSLAGKESKSENKKLIYKIADNF